MGLEAWPTVTYFVPEENSSSQILPASASKASVKASEEELERGLMPLDIFSDDM